MTRRPDVFDQPRGRHNRCVCGDEQPCTCGPVRAPAQGFRIRRILRPMFWNDFLLAVEIAVEAFQRALTPRLDEILEEIKKMAVNTDELVADINTLVGGYQAVKDENVALKAENGQLRSALESADADKAAAVAAAEAADQAQVDAADAIVDKANAPAEQPPADSGDGSAPVE